MLVGQRRDTRRRRRRRTSCLSARSLAASESRDVKVGVVSRPVSCLTPPPSRSGKKASARNFAAPSTDDVDRDAGDDVVDAEGDGGERVQQPADRTQQRGAEDARPTGRSSR